MDAHSHWYAVSVAFIIAVLVIRRLANLLTPCFPLLRHWTLHATNPLFFACGWNWTSLNYIEAAALSIYVAANVALIFADRHQTSDLILRSGRMAAVNMILLFLGGRTNPLADRLGIPLHTYYLAHYWIGGMVIAQALLHASLEMSTRGAALDRITVSGALVACSLIALPASSFIRRTALLLSGLHTLLALSVIGGMLWHLIHGEFITILLPSISLSIWAITSLIRLVRTLRNRGTVIYLPDSQIGQETHAFTFVVQVPRVVSFDPGTYLYLYFGWQWRQRLQSQPLMLAWYEHRREDSRGVTYLTFIVQPRGRLTRRLERELQLSHVSSRPLTVWFEGPYGQDLHLERYETVMLVAKGVGIAGVLPYAQHLLQRKFRDGKVKELLQQGAMSNKQDLRNSLHRDATRKVDLFWVLEENRQEELVSDHLLTLQETDSKRSSLIYCYYPERKISEPRIKIDAGWKCIYPGDRVSSLNDVIEDEAGKSRRNIVVACGDAAFIQDIRKTVRRVTSKDNIVEFVELEYRPRGKTDQIGAEVQPPQTRGFHYMPNMRLDETRPIELTQLTRNRNVVSKPPRRQFLGRTEIAQDRTAIV